jgi:hydrogenase maturation protein HypF
MNPNLYPYEIHADQIDVREMIRAIVADPNAGKFHATLAAIVVDVCERIRENTSLERVCLSGGVFHNLRLLGLVKSGLERSKFQVFLHHRVPANDGGLSLGQAVIAGNRWLAR